MCARNDPSEIVNCKRCGVVDVLIDLSKEEDLRSGSVAHDGVGLVCSV